jgi:hypothetical protein
MWGMERGASKIPMTPIEALRWMKLKEFNDTDAFDLPGGEDTLQLASFLAQRRFVDLDSAYKIYLELLTLACFMRRPKEAVSLLTVVERIRAHMGHTEETWLYIHARRIIKNA